VCFACSCRRQERRGRPKGNNSAVEEQGQPSADAKPPATTTIGLATTTSTDNSGLLAHLLPAFKADASITVQAIAVGTGKAIKHGESGDVDVTFVHDLSAGRRGQCIDDARGNVEGYTRTMATATALEAQEYHPNDWSVL